MGASFNCQAGRQAATEKPEKGEDLDASSSVFFWLWGEWVMGFPGILLFGTQQQSVYLWPRKFSI